MVISHKFFNYVSGMIVILLSFSSCHGIVHGLYDEPMAEIENRYGFIYIDEENRSGTIYIDATDYTEWHYIDLHSKTISTKAVGDEVPQDWDFAIHRYDAKTNSASVYESPYEDFASLSLLDSLSEYSFVPDIWTKDRITIDMSQMMDGIIVYAEDYYNECLSLWLDVDTSTMPPIYTLSSKIYVLRLEDGSYAALRLANFMNDAAVKGFMTIDYIYPIVP